MIRPEEVIANIELGGYAPEQRATLERALEVMAGMHWDADAICRELGGRSWSTVTRFLQGKPQGDVEGVVADFARLVARHAGQQLIRTPIVEDYERVLANCRADGRMGLIVARNGRGKTLTINDWARRNPRARAKVVHAPSGCSRPDLVLLICRAFSIDPDAHTQPARERELLSTLTARDMLIVDEAGNLISQRKASPIRVLQDIHDLCRCPVVLTMRPSQWARFEAGRTANDEEQFLGRILHRSIITGPAAAYKREEVEAIVAHFAPGAISTALRRAIRDALHSETGGLRALCADLQLAADFSAQDATVDFAAAFITAASRRRTADTIARLEDF